MTVKNLFPPLLKGDKIGIASVSGKTNHDKILRGVNFLKTLGYFPVLAENISDSQRYMSGNDDTRVKGFMDLLRQKDLKGVIFARGGFGALRMIEKIDFSVLNKFNGFFMGYSDITVLLNMIAEKTHHFVFHGPNFSDLDKSDTGIINNIFKGLIPNELCGNKEFISPGVASGILCGGNLASLASLCGTRFMPVFKDKIVFLEDVNEVPYKIDRMLSQLRLSGSFNGVKGIIAGSFEGCGEIDLIFEILKECFPKIPIVFSDCYGHGNINNPLLLGHPVEINSFSQRVVYL